LRRGLVLTDGDLAPFFTRPICLLLWVIIAVSILWQVPLVKTAITRLFAGVGLWARQK
jgi:putative tricarboxylic transport membrane protein